MKTPPVSIIILNWNGKKWLKGCLPTVRRIKYKPLEVIIVNNGSTDDSAKFIRDKYPEVRVIELKKNVGYAKANNIGVSKAKGEYVLLMNNDTKVTPNFLKPLAEDLKDSAIGVVQPQIRSMIYPKLLDSVVSYFTYTGFLYHFGYMKPWNKEKYQKKTFAYSIKGACFLMRKKEYLELGGLDEDFVCYVEETDLCHRVWLSGKKVLYDPRSIMYHWGGGDMQVMTKDETTMLRSFRNRFLSYIKNLSIVELLKVLPALFIFSEIFVVMSIIKGEFRRAFGAQLGILTVLLYLPQAVRKRKFIQKNIRKVSDKQINEYVYKNPRFSYYLLSFRNPSAYKD
ncbi:MAG: glycosyltransferase family 2 protein [Patescibacteria group bacterium]|nr:glycosyltransferase family 2 protein [Patescibacteria group bacterium]